MRSCPLERRGYHYLPVFKWKLIATQCSLINPNTSFPFVFAHLLLFTEVSCGTCLLPVFAFGGGKEPNPPRH